LHIKSDDEAILFFSMDEDPANKVFMSILMLKLFTTDLTNYHNLVVMFYKNIYLLAHLAIGHVSTKNTNLVEDHPVNISGKFG
jgi:hypothetical protein